MRQYKYVAKIGKGSFIGYYTCKTNLLLIQVNSKAKRAVNGFLYFFGRDSLCPIRLLVKIIIYHINIKQAFISRYVETLVQESIIVHYNMHFIRIDVSG